METSLSQAPIPWQLGMFRRSLKKQQKLEALLAELGNVTNQECLLLTCGDNNGALNWHFRAWGGNWTWGDVAGENLSEMSALLGDPVFHVSEDHFPFADNQFNCVVAIDVLEHLGDDLPFLAEIHRVLEPSGKAIVTVPNGDSGLLANRIKWRVGMTPQVYGHNRAGYTLVELRQAMARAGFEPLSEGSYSGFFTEMIELAINFGYVFVLKRKMGDLSNGHIAPTSSNTLNAHGTAYRLYTWLYPLINLVSKLDLLNSAKSHGAVIVVGGKYDNNECNNKISSQSTRVL